MWSRGRHFRIASRDGSKTTADSFISAYFDVGLKEKQEFIGQIDQILELNYDSVKPILFKVKWYDNNVSPGRASTKLIYDECGIQCVLAKEFMKDNHDQHEPFVWPVGCNQVFLVPNRLNKHWQLVVDTEVRKSRPTLHMPSDAGTVQSTVVSRGGEEEVEEETLVGSESEEEIETGKGPSTAEEDVYEEEILTYKRRTRPV
jgi:hypothetical protein